AASNKVSTNVIAGNGVGVELANGGTQLNIVESNFIGVNATGARIANTNGVYVHGGATSNTVGGSSSGAGNVISGNSGYGVWIGDAGTSSNTVRYNRIGTDATAMTAIGNSVDGVLVANGATSNGIRNNVISGNRGAGVHLSDATTEFNAVTSIFIGT